MNGPTILLAEDNSTDVLLVQRALHKGQVTAALQVVEDGEKAVAYLAGESIYADRTQYPLPILLLLDIKLPRQSGLEVLAWLRQQPGLKRLPVVVLTVSTESADINRAYELGANSYLVKPVNFDGFQEMMKALGLYWLVHNRPPEIHVEPTV